MELHKIILGAIFMSLIVTGIFVFFTGGSNSYATADYNDTNLLVLKSQLNNLTSQTADIENKTRDVKVNENLLDLLGGFFKSGYTALKVTWDSVGVFNTVTNTALDSASSSLPDAQGNFFSTLKGALLTSIIIVIFLGITIAVLIKSERI